MSMKRHRQMLECLIVLTLCQGVICSIEDDCQKIKFEEVVNADHFNLTRTSLTDLSINRTCMTISWFIEDTTNICGFTVYVWKVIDGSAKAHMENVSKDVGARTMLIENLKPGTLYEIYIETKYATQHKTVSWKQEAKTLGFGPDNNVPKCSIHGTEAWDQETGACECKQHITVGKLCDSCLPGAYMHPKEGCLACDNCGIRLGRNGTCRYDENELMLCNCMEGYTGKHCDSCVAGYYFRELISDVSLPCIKCNSNTTNNPNCYHQSASPADITEHHGAIIGVFSTIMVAFAILICYICNRHRRSNKRTRGFVAAHTKEHNDRIKFSPMMEDAEADFYSPGNKK